MKYCAGCRRFSCGECWKPHDRCPVQGKACNALRGGDDEGFGRAVITDSMERLEVLDVDHHEPPLNQLAYATHLTDGEIADHIDQRIVDINLLRKELPRSDDEGPEDAPMNDVKAETVKGDNEITATLCYKMTQTEEEKKTERCKRGNVKQVPTCFGK